MSIEEIIYDGLHRRVNLPGMKLVFKTRNKLIEWNERLKVLSAEIQQLARQPGGKLVEADLIEEALLDCARRVNKKLPFVVCSEKRPCSKCNDKQWLSVEEFLEK